MLHVQLPFIKELCQNDKTRRLYSHAQRKWIRSGHKPYRIRFADKRHLKGFPAHASPEENAICLYNRDSFLEQLSSLIFELTKFLQFNKFDRINYKLIYGRYPMRRTTYINLSENVEYNGIKIYNKVVRYGINHSTWSHNTDVYQE